MNRIILIGNGFDLAHGMKTSYKDFINAYWEQTIEEMKECSQLEYKNKEIHVKSNKFLFYKLLSGYGEHSLREIKKIIQINIGYLDDSPILKARVDFDIKNKFLELISNRLSLSKWVDIENIYYGELKKYLVTSPLDKLADAINDVSNKKNIDTLNKDFDGVKCLLEKYLTDQEVKFQMDEDLNKHIGAKIYSPISDQDIANSKINNLAKHIHDKIELTKKYINENTYLDFTQDHEYYKYVSMKSLYYIKDCIQDLYSGLGSALLRTADSITGIDRFSHKILDDLKNNKIPDYLLLPNNICFLNFNYTHTPKNYITNDDNIEYISIHGELNNKENPMIFGYGDELDESYQQIENLNDNRYMENVKSVKYLETDNYRRLLNFINSDRYQVFVMGHSCGNSDRTLLNTLFDHDNCFSIKPFYYRYKDDEGNLKDNYSDIVRNISRNFTDKQKLRERVVNKTYCEPLVGEVDNSRK